jgi:hypothetical protein
MTLSRDLILVEFLHISACPSQLWAPCLVLPYLTTIRIVDRTPSHDSNCGFSPILSLVFMVKTPFNSQ